MSKLQSGSGVGVEERLCLHPSVGLWVEPGKLDARQKVAAVAKARWLEHDLFDGDRVRRDLDERQIGDIVGQINRLRRALGWLEVDLTTLRNRPHPGRGAS